MRKPLQIVKTRLRTYLKIGAVKRKSFGEAAETSTRAACAPRNFTYRVSALRQNRKYPRGKTGAALRFGKTDHD